MKKTSNFYIDFLITGCSKVDTKNETNNSAKKENASTFSTLPNSASILQNINDANYIYYAPYIGNDNLELYYTRYLKGKITSSTIFEICVAVRSNALS